jgi:hypothetical protein
MALAFVRYQIIRYFDRSDTIKIIRSSIVLRICIVLLENQKFNLTFIYSIVNLHYFIFLFSVLSQLVKCQNFQCFDHRPNFSS